MSWNGYSNKTISKSIRCQSVGGEYIRVQTKLRIYQYPIYRLEGRLQDLRPVKSRFRLEGRCCLDLSDTDFSFRLNLAIRDQSFCRLNEKGDVTSLLTVVAPVEVVEMRHYNSFIIVLMSLDRRLSLDEVRNLRSEAKASDY